MAADSAPDCIPDSAPDSTPDSNRDSATHTHALVVLDRSGSMQAVRDDVIGGFNAMLADQQRIPGEATLTLVQFDSENPCEVIHLRKPLAEVPPLTVDTYVPRGSTPLLDAIGRSLNELDVALANLPEDRRPDHVLVALFSDGRENASREFSYDVIRQMIEEREGRTGWEVLFFSWGREALKEAESLGVRHESRRSYGADALGVRSGLKDLSSSMTDMRTRPRRRIGFPSPPKPQDG